VELPAGSPSPVGGGAHPAAAFPPAGTLNPADPQAALLHAFLTTTAELRERVRPNGLQQQLTTCRCGCVCWWQPTHSCGRWQSVFVYTVQMRSLDAQHGGQSGGQGADADTL
jgi:hypothetical protein